MDIEVHYLTGERFAALCRENRLNPTDMLEKLMKVYKEHDSVSRFKRLKVSTFTIPKHKYDIPYRVVLLGRTFNNKTYYSIALESKDPETGEIWFSYDELYNAMLTAQMSFTARMMVNNVKEDTTFKPEEEYTEWK